MAGLAGPEQPLAGARIGNRVELFEGHFLFHRFGFRRCRFHFDGISVVARMMVVILERRQRRMHLRVHHRRRGRLDQHQDQQAAACRAQNFHELKTVHRRDPHLVAELMLMYPLPLTNRKR